MHESVWVKGITYLQNIKYDFIKQVEIHNVVNSLESFRGVVIVGCSARQETQRLVAQLKTINNIPITTNTSQISGVPIPYALPLYATSKEILLKFGHKDPSDR